MSVARRDVALLSVHCLDLTAIGTMTGGLMATFIYRCPNTGLKIQGWVADEADARTNDESYQPVTCLACRQTHLVNPSSGKVVSASNN